MKELDYIALDLCGYRFNRKYPPDQITKEWNLVNKFSQWKKK